MRRGITTRARRRADARRCVLESARPCRKAAARRPCGSTQDKIAGLNLTAIPPDAYQEILVAGQLNMRVATLFEGKELRVSIFESTPAKTDHRTRPTDVDEFVYVLSGKLILTEPSGTRHEYVPGDSLVLPIGYTGTWEMQGNYRELVVLAQK